MLNVLAPGVGSVKKTIVIAASQADERGVIEIGVGLGPESSQMAQVSAAELAIPKEAARAYQRALDSLGRGDKSQAVRHLERACELAPDYANAWNRLGTIAFKSGKYRQAETYFRTALERDPSFYPALVNLGGALLSQGRRREAWVVNLKAVEDEPEDPLAHAQLGANYLELNQLDQADKHLNIAKSLDPAHFSNPQLLLAKIHGLRGDYPALASELKEFLEIHPDYPNRAQLELLIRQAESRATE